MNHANPIHHIVPNHLEYSRINNAEVMPGITTAASWTFWDEPIERAFRRAMFDLGTLDRTRLAAPADPAERLRAMFYGRVATNISFHRAIARQMPPALETALVEHLFADTAGRAAPVNRVRAYRWRIPWLVLRLPQRLRAEHTAAKRWWREATDPARPPADLPMAIDRLRAAYAEFERAQTLNITASLLSAIPVQQIIAQARQAGLDDIVPAVISGYGTEEAIMAQRLAAIADGGDTVAAFLRDFGFHGQAEGQLHRRSWREAPDVVETRVDAFRNGVTHGRSADTVRAAKRAAEARLLAGVRDRRRLRFNLALAQRLMPQREITKAWYLMTIDTARAALRQIGRLAVAAGLLDQPDDAFHLTINELFAGPSPAWRITAVERRAQWTAYHALDIPEHFNGMPVPFSQADADLAGASQTHLTGIGVSAGVVEGRARVVREADGVDELLDGEILVCRSTDPSWAPAFMIASAVVIDIGSMLSHGAIVARELGLPCVINTGTATSTIRTGDLIRIDGSAGTVDITVRAAA